jgi:LPLT family lysophospholipid transporter-like MFS transporter
MIATLLSQFLSALADNALLFAALAFIRVAGYPAWTGPLLQEFFVATYILLAPFVGVFADSRPKGGVMTYANVVKFTGALAMCLHLNPFLSYAIVGVGAAFYSPAKYGILTELTSRENLVKANGILEGATIAAILSGALLGGTLTDWSVEGALLTITGCYATAAASALLIPRVGRGAPPANFALATTLRAFAANTATLFKNNSARVALIGTSLFWGTGAALRFLVIAWVPVALHVTNNRLPGFLTGMVAAGIVVGAALAARFVRLEAVNRALPAGILIGVGVCMLPLATSLPQAFTVMAFVGACSGFFVVPLDALLQGQADQRIGVGEAIAIQNLFENVSMLVLVSGYTAATFMRAPVNDIAVGVGLFIALSMGALVFAGIRADGS